MARGITIAATLDSSRLRGALGILKGLGLDQGPFLAALGDVLEGSVRNRFDTGRGPGGIPWAPTKRQYRQAVGSDGPNRAQILVDQGLLLGSLRHEVDGNTLRVGFDGASRSSKFAYAHQFGSHRRVAVTAHTRVINEAFGIPLPTPKTAKVKAGSRMTNLPKREMLGVDAQDRRDGKEAMRDVLRDRLK